MLSLDENLEAEEIYCPPDNWSVDIDCGSTSMFGLQRDPALYIKLPHLYWGPASKEDDASSFIKPQGAPDIVADPHVSDLPQKAVACR